MKKFAPIFIIVATIAIIGYFDSALFAEKEDLISSFPIPTEGTASATISNENNEQSQQKPILETKLVDITEDDGYVVEVYREYEVYKDEEGNIIENKPTENYQYLRYKE
ncbi:MAG: hypothetical protein ACQEWV_16290 [Bacillota bacterium]